MCGIVGLHLRNPELYPRLGELLTGMLCEMGDRGSDSAGVAVYGDPIWSPPGRACVSVLEVGADSRRHRPRRQDHPGVATRICSRQRCLRRCCWTRSRRPTRRH